MIIPASRCRVQGTEIDSALTRARTHTDPQSKCCHRRANTLSPPYSPPSSNIEDTTHVSLSMSTSAIALVIDSRDHAGDSHGSDVIRDASRSLEWRKEPDGERMTRESNT